MANELKGLPNHSAEYFGDTRDFWWHDDQLSALAAQWRLAEVSSVLDVGCGVGHWGRTLARVLPTNARVTGVDRDPLWIQKATERARAAALAERFQYAVAPAETLPFESGSFDLVTCQTLLMHVAEPARVVAELTRVTRPGGLVVVAEGAPISGITLDSVALGDTPEVTAELVRFQLTCDRGKRLAGEGDNNIGDALPRLLLAAGLKAIDVRLNTGCWALQPPYDSPFERAQVSELLDAAERGLFVWDEATTHRYFVAGGGDERTFAAHWQRALEQLQRVAAAVRAGSHARAGGSLFFIAWGRRPSAGDCR